MKVTTVFAILTNQKKQTAHAVDRATETATEIHHTTSNAVGDRLPGVHTSDER